MNANRWSGWISRLFREPRSLRPRSGQNRLSVESLEDRVTPATFDWKGGGGNNLWSNPNNWVGNAAPGDGADLNFGAAATNRNTSDDLTGLVFKSITISASGYTIGGTAPALVVSGGIIVGSNLGNEQITINLQLAAPSGSLQETITVNGGSNLVVTGNLDGRNDPLEAQQTITKDGPGTLTLTHDNSGYAGAITLATSGGIVVITNPNALGTGSKTTVNVNSQLQLKNLNAPVTEQLFLNGVGVVNVGALLNIAGNNTWAGTITLDSDAAIGVAANTALNDTALITDTGAGHSLTKMGEGKLVMSRVGGNTYRGQTIIDNGILTIRDPLSLGAGADITKPQSGQPGSGTIVNYNSTTGEAGTLQIEFTTLDANDPNAVLQDPTKPFNAQTNPVIGFQVFNDLLTLNGPGFNPTNPNDPGAGSLGALQNLTGFNIWDGDVTLGSLPPSTGFINIGVAANSQLLIAGTIDDPNRQPQLHKILPGRLIFDHANAYDGGTFVDEGALRIRDSQALGTGAVQVVTNTALELEVDSGLDGTPQRTHNRNLGFDSTTFAGPGQEVFVPGTTGTFTLTFKGATTGAISANSPTLAADIQNALNALSTIGGSGGSVTVTQSGNTFRVIFGGSLVNADVPLMTAAGTANAKVNAIYGLNVANTLSLNGFGLPVTGNGLTAGALYSISGLNIYSGDIGLGDASIGVDPDVRPGHELANPDYFKWDHSLTVTGTISGGNLTKLRGGDLILPFANTYGGKTDVKEGWITVQDNNSLGTKPIGMVHTLWQPTTVFAGAAVHLLPLVAGTSLLVPNNFVLSGNGIDHPFDLIDQAGAIENLAGNNTLSGIIQLNGNAGIGVEQITPPVPGENASELTLTGYTWDFGATPGGLTKLGTRRLTIQSPGSFTGPVDIKEGVVLNQNDTGLGASTGTVTVESGAALEIGNSVVEQTGGLTGGLGIWGKHLVLNGQGNSLFGDTPLAILSSNAPVNGPINNPITTTDNTWRGPISLSNDTVITVGPNSRLIITGAIDDASNPSAGGSDITFTGGGVVELNGTNTYRGSTFIDQGVLIVRSGQALGDTGHAEVQTITLTGATANTTRFTLTFNGQTTAPILFTGNAATDAAAIQAALNGLSSIGGSTVGGQVVVAPGATAGTFVVSFVGALKGFDQPLLTAAITVNPGTIAVVQTTRGGGGTEVAEGASLQLAGSFTVAGEPLLVHGNGNASTPSVPTQWFQVGPAPITNGQTPGNQNVTGRINASVADPRDPNVMYVATSGGGAWKTIDGGKTWRPLFDAIPEIQTVTVTTNGSFTLTFMGQTTTALNGSSPTLAADMQAALNALSTIGGKGGYVTVTKSGNVYRVVFAGSLIGSDVLQMTGSAGAGVLTVEEGRDPRFAMFVGSITLDPNNPDIVYVGTGDPNSTGDTFYGTGIYVSKDAGVTWSLLTDNNGLNPFDGKAVSKIVIDPRVGTLYAASGDRIAPRNEEQLIDIYLGTGSQFTLSFTHADANGNVVTQTTAPITIQPSDAATAVLIQNALNALSTINGAAVVTVEGLLLFKVTFTRNLANTNVAQLVANPGFAAIIMSTTVEGGQGDVNGTTGGPGIWRLQNGLWFNLTSVVSVNRSTRETGQAVPPSTNANTTASASAADKIPNTPGPDDDYRMQFPQSNATWTDLTLIYTDITNLGLPSPFWQPVLYAALGTTPADVDPATGYNGEDINNAVFWSESPTANSPIWYVGDPGGSPFSTPAVDPTGVDSRSGGFPRGATGNPFGVPVPSNAPYIPEFPIYGNIKLSVVPGPTLNTGTVYASASTPDGQLRGVLVTRNGGQTWNPTTAQPPNYLYTTGNFANAILAVDANTVIVGGQGVNAAGAQTILLTTNGGASWADISGSGPHAGIHGLSLDNQLRVLVSTDGGLWRLNTNGSWTNLNGNLAISDINSVSSNPVSFTSAFAGSQANGIDRFTNNQTWNRLDSYGAAVVAVDPNNSQTIYAVSLLTGTNAVVRKSTDGGATWTTILATNNPTAPLTVDSVNSARLLVGGVRLMESLNGGASWTNLLAPITVQDVAIANAQGAFVIDPSFLQVADKGTNNYDADTIYVTDGTSIYVTKNHAQTWINRTSNLAGLGSISDIVVDPRNRDHVYAVRSAFGGGKVFESTDAGQTWANITFNLPDLPTWKLVIDPRNGFLYVGTDEGVFQSKNNGTTWNLFGTGLPNVQVRDLDLNLITDTLLAGTGGRSVYQLFLDTRQTEVPPVNASIVALSGSSIWTGNVILDGDSGTNTVTVGAYGAPNLPNTIPAASLNFVGPISDQTSGENPTLRKLGLGDVIFSGANIYGGQTVVQEGPLVVDNAHALGSNANGTTVVDGAVLELRSNLDAEPITLNGNGLSFDGHYTGALRNIAGDNTYVGPLTLNTDSTIGVDSGSQLTIGTTPQLPGTGTVNGVNDLTKELTGTLVLASDNAGFSGETFVNRGALRLQNAGALGVGAAGARVLDGAQIQLKTAAGDPPLVINRPLDISGTGIFNSGAILNVGGNNTWAGPITFDALPGFSPDTFPAGIVSINVANPDDTLTISGSIGENAATGLTKIGPGQLVLASSNTYSGANEILEGTLNVRDPGALGLRSGTASVQRIVVLSSQKTGSFRIGFNGQFVTLNWSGGSPPTAAAVEAALNALSSIGGAGGSVTVTRVEIPTTTQNGPGLPGTGFLYTIVFGGTLTNTTIPLTASGQNGTGASASVAATGGVDTRVWNGATLELDATGSPTPGGFTITGHQLIASGDGVGGHGALRGGAGSNTWDGPISLPIDTSVGVVDGNSLALSGGINAAGRTLTKVDPGTLIFPDDPDANTQSLTKIQDGSVQVDGSIGNVQLSGGVVSGTGSVAAITSTTGGGINPGDNFPTGSTGTLQAASAGLNTTNLFIVNLNGSATPTNDLLQVSGNINLGGATLAGTVANVAIGDSFTIIQAGSVTGQFAGPSATPQAGGTSATVAYIGATKFIVDYFPDHVVLTRALADTTVALSAKPAKGTKLRAFTFTAQVAGTQATSSTPTGTVTFTDTTTGAVLGTATVNASGVATLVAAVKTPDHLTAPLGTHVIQASYSGDASFDTSSDTTTIQIIANGTRLSTVKLKSSANPWIVGSPVTFTATVRDIGGTPLLNPGGTVEFFDVTTNTLLGYGTLSVVTQGVTRTTFTTSFAQVGTHDIRVRYSGNAIFAVAKTDLNQEIVAEPSRTTSTVISEPAGQPDPSPFGQALSFTAEVDDTGGGNVTPTGTVTFTDATTNTVLGVVSLSPLDTGKAVATLVTSALDVGTHSIVATYNGSLVFAIGIPSTPEPHTVVQASSAMTLTSNANPSKFGQSVTFKATMTSNSGAIPSGQVVFKADGTIIGSGFIDPATGVATFTTNALAVGTHAITAEYAGSTNFSASNIGALSQEVDKSATKAKVILSTTDPGVPLTVVAKIKAILPGTTQLALPTGQATILIDGVNKGTIDLVNGKAKLVVPSGLSLGTHKFVVQYSGDGNFAASSTTVFVSFGGRG